MKLVSDLRMYGRFAFGLRRFLREKATLESAKATLLHDLEHREDRFLSLVRRGVFGYAKSPYLPLFELAQCRYADVEEMVRSKGLDPALLALREAGVYVTFEECKGRERIVRSGKEIPVEASDFDNPYTKKSYTQQTGGSTGAGTRVHHDLDFLAERGNRDLILQAAHGVADAPAAVWRGVLPDGSGINTSLARARFGQPPVRWFTPVAPQELDGSLLKFRVATQAAVFLTRLFGTPLPWPEKVPVDQAIVVARWAADTVRESGKAAVFCVASRALRVSVAAQEAGLDLSGTTFVVAGEPITPAKARGIEASGAHYFTTYGFSEGGRFGAGCGNPASSNDLHLYADMCAVIPYPREVEGLDEPVPAFNVTSLSPAAPKILINAESDDYGVVEQRECGCPLGELGLTTHLRDIRSFRKLTGEGVTMLGSQMLRIVEDVLPSKFGGTPLDYQIMEEEDEQGFTRVSLVVSPTVPVEDEAALAQGFLDAVAEDSAAGGVAGYNWAQAGAVRIKRMQPILTGRGKLLPLYVAKRHADYSPRKS